MTTLQLETHRGDTVASSTITHKSRRVALIAALRWIRDAVKADPDAMHYVLDQEFVLFAEGKL